MRGERTVINFCGGRNEYSLLGSTPGAPRQARCVRRLLRDSVDRPEGVHTQAFICTFYTLLWMNGNWLWVWIQLRGSQFEFPDINSHSLVGPWVIPNT